MRRWIEAALCLAIAVFVLFIYRETHITGDTSLVKYYISNFISDTGAQNGVTAIYLNYRVFDTIFEALMLLVSVVAVIYLSWRREHE